MDKQIYSLTECANHTPQEVGNKAYWLGCTSRLIQNVPAGICLLVSCFRLHLQSLPTYQEITSLIHEAYKNKVYVRRNLSLVRAMIQKSALSEALMGEVKAALERNRIDLYSGVAVRSSSKTEDDVSHAFAGVFTSFIDISSEKELEESILRVWASYFSEVLLFHCEEKAFLSFEMAVVIQQMKHGAYHGVLFTKSPYDDLWMLVEAGTSVSGIVEGNLPVCTARINRTTGEMDAGDFPFDPAKLARLGWLLEKEFDMFCDIEWVYSQGEIYLVQCRPISNYVYFRGNYLIVSQDDEDVCSNLYLGSCHSLYCRYVGKQQLFRKTVVEAGYSVYGQYYVILKKDAVDAAAFWHDLYRDIADWDDVILEFSKEEPSVMCKKSQLKELLTARSRQTAAEYLYCRIGEVIRAELSGYSTLAEAGGVFIEYIAGRLSWLMNGKGLPTQLILTNGTAVYLSRPVNESIADIDEATGRNTIRKYGMQCPLLTKGQLQDIADFTIKLSERLSCGRFEWYIRHGKLYGKDLSAEEGLLPISEKTKSFLSIGSCRGQVQYIRNLDQLEDIAQKYDISLYHHSKEEEEIYGETVVQALIEEISSKEAVILFAERPSIGLLPLVTYVKGMVFRKGAMLSHMGIYLREQHIPAVIAPDQYPAFSDDEAIEISPSGDLTRVHPN